MEVKIDTREKFHVISIKEPVLSANMTEELGKCLFPILEKDVKNVVLNLEAVQELEAPAAAYLAQAQQQFYEQQCSFVICCLSEGVEAALDRLEILELMNVTPTESEAWDIVQMEEIEREFMGGDGPED